MRTLNFLRPLSIKNKARFGNQQDGGYVIYKKPLEDTDQLLTYGVGWDTSFEEHFKESTGKAVLMFDPTMYEKNFLSLSYMRALLLRFRFWQAFKYLLAVKRLWCQHRGFKKKGLHFQNEGLSDVKRGKLDTLKNHLERFGLKDKTVLLKIDIEGGEYRVFNDPELLNTIRNVNQILIEWHDLKNRLLEVKRAVALLDREFQIVHIHGNNYGGTFRIYNSLFSDASDIQFPDVIEMTLVRRECIDPSDYLQSHFTFPVAGLDYPNNPYWEDIRIEFEISNGWEGD